MAHCLKLTELQGIFNVVLISDCYSLSRKKWDYVIDEFKLAFINQSKYFDEIIQFQKKKLVMIKLLLEKAKQENKIVILIVDQINWADEEGDKILSDLLGFQWTMIVISESANNNFRSNKKFADFKKLEYMKLLSEKSVELIIKNDFPKLQLDLTDLSKIIKISNFIVREAVLICDSEGMSVDEKIQNYKSLRLKDFTAIHDKFINQLNPYQLYQLLRSIFHLDKDFFIEFDYIEPIINNQLMICERKEKNSNFFKINSILPMVHNFLEKYFYAEIKKNKEYSKGFYDSCATEIKSIVQNPVTDSRIIGIYFEELVTLRFQQSCELKQEILLFLQTASYLNTQNPINYNVILNLFNFILF